MNNRLLYKAFIANSIRAFMFFSMSIVCTIYAMEKSHRTAQVDLLTFKSSESKSVTLDSSLVSPTILQALSTHISNTEHPLHHLSISTWKILFDLFLMDKLSREQPSIEFDRKSDENPFCRHTLTPEDADNALLAASSFTLMPEVSDQIFCAYVLFCKGTIKAVILAQLNERQKTTLDKFCYLAFKNHIDLPKEQIATVSFKELLTFQKVRTFINKQGLDLDLRNYYLSDLTDWKNLLHNTQIRPELIKVLDLSENYLKDIDHELLSSFINLEDLLLAKNQIESLPEKLLKDCSKLKKLDLSYNSLQDIALIAKLLESCTSLQILLIDHNKLPGQRTETSFNTLLPLSTLNMDHNPHSSTSELLKKTFLDPLEYAALTGSYFNVQQFLTELQSKAYARKQGFLSYCLSLVGSALVPLSLRAIVTWPDISVAYTQEEQAHLSRALMYAVAQNRTEIVKLLLDFGADPFKPLALIKDILKREDSKCSAKRMQVYRLLLEYALKNIVVLAHYNGSTQQHS